MSGRVGRGSTNLQFAGGQESTNRQFTGVACSMKYLRAYSSRSLNGRWQLCLHQHGRVALVVKGRLGSDQLAQLLFDSGYKFSVPLDAIVSVEVVVTRKSNSIRNFPCTVLQCPVVLTSLAWSPLPCIPIKRPSRERYQWKWNLSTRSPRRWGGERKRSTFQSTVQAPAWNRFQK